MACMESDYSMVDPESDYEDDVFEESNNEENVAPPAKGSKPASKSAKTILSSNNDSKNVPASGKGGKKTVEQMYQKKTQLEHILIRPDTYIGSVEPLKETMFVFDATTKRMVNREITFTPGLYKIFDENKWKANYYMTGRDHAADAAAEIVNCMETQKLRMDRAYLVETW